MGNRTPYDSVPHFQLSEPCFLDQSPTASSSRRALSMENPYHPSLLPNMAGTSGTVSNPILEDPSEVPAHLLAMQAFCQHRNVHLPTPAIEEEAMTRAMIAVLSSPAASSSSSNHSQIPTHQRRCDKRRTAFGPYDPDLAALFKRRRSSCGGGHGKMKRLFAFLRTIRTQMQETCPAATNQLHVISERKRRKQLNESFQALKELLPPGFKKDKSSVLSKTREYLTILKDEVVELQKKKQSMEALLASEGAAALQGDPGCHYGGGDERALVMVQAVDVCGSSSSGERRIELHVLTREEDCDVIDLLIRVLECLKQMKDVSPEFVHAETHLQQMNRAIFNVKIKTSEWDQSSFKEAVTRAVGDVAQRGTSIS